MPYTYAPDCTEIFAVTEITYSDATETVIISDTSDTRFGACQLIGFTEVEITSRFTFSPAVCPSGWAAYSLSAVDNAISTAWCCNSGYTLYSANDWPVAWATQPCIQVLEEQTTIAGAVISPGCTAAHAPWHISWQSGETTSLWPVPPVWAVGQCIETWTPGVATVYATTIMDTTTTKAAAPAPVGNDNGNDSTLGPDSTLFWFLVIGLPILGILAMALFCCVFYYGRAQNRARQRRRRRRTRRIKIVET